MKKRRKKEEMKALAVIDKNRALGYRNELLFHLPTDLAHFRKHTLGNTVLMGQKTLESMPKGRALPGRNCLVLNSDAPTAKLYDIPLAKGQSEGSFFCCSFNNLDDFHEFIRTNQKSLGEIVLSGGASVYSLLLDECDSLVLTEVDAKAPAADVYFPEFRDKFRCVSEEGPFFDGELRYYIRTYVKK